VDLYLASGTTVVSFDTTNNLGDDAVAYVEAPFTGTFNIAISLCAGPPPTLMKWMASFGSASSIEYDTKSSTSWGHKNQEFTAGVGAAFFTNTPEFGQDPPLLEPFSSRGGTPVLFEVDGTRKTEPRVLEQPRFVATDGCINTFFGQVDNFPPNGIGSYFFGMWFDALSSFLLELFHLCLTYPIQSCYRNLCCRPECCRCGYFDVAGQSKLNAHGTVYDFAGNGD
jgi:hypothetical protein